MWLFSRSNDTSAEAGIISSLPNAADAHTVTQKNMKTEGHEDHAVSTSLIDRSKINQLAVTKGDGRVSFFDTDSIDCIVKHYDKEMTVADQKIKQKQQKKERKMLNLYDYEGDRRYNQWLADQERVRENLKLHWLDFAIDRPMLCFKYLTRVGTTAGLFYGLGRSVFLYRTMDKMYAKLHGVSFSNIALYEVSLAVIKGTVVSAAGVVGVVVGESATNIATTVITGDISAPERTWVNVCVCGTSCGLFSGAAFAALHASTLTSWGMAAAATAMTVTGSIGGFGLGFYSYKPYAATREKRINDPYWRPWYQRRIADSGGAYMRGRYS